MPIWPKILQDFAHAYEYDAYIWYNVALYEQLYKLTHDSKQCFVLCLNQGCKKIIDLDLKDRDHLIDLDLLGDLDHY